MLGCRVALPIECILQESCLAFNVSCIVCRMHCMRVQACKLKMMSVCVAGWCVCILCDYVRCVLCNRKLVSGTFA